VLIALAVAGVAFAEQELTLELATLMIEAAQAQANELGVPMVIAVIDEGGNLVAFARMDGAPLISIDVAISKAWTANALKGPTDGLAAIAEPGGFAYGVNTLNDRIVLFGGGIPVMKDGRVIGAIGASGGSIEQDIMVAETGLSAVAP
jgi:uncharacterized protein GlcG (DUF336 family)